MKQSGIPTVVKEHSGIAATIALPEVAPVSLSSMIGGYLSAQDEAAMVAVDINGRKFAAGPQAEIDGEVNDATDAIQALGQGDFKQLTIAPVGGQVGRSLAFGSEGTSGDLVAPVLQSIVNRLQPVAPKFTVESLVSMIAGEIPSDSTQRFLVVLDQGNARVKIFAYEGAVPAEVAALFANAGEAARVVVTLADPAENNVAPRAFEGGAV